MSFPGSFSTRGHRSISIAGINWVATKYRSKPKPTVIVLPIGGGASAALDQAVVAVSFKYVPALIPRSHKPQAFNTGIVVVTAGECVIRYMSPYLTRLKRGQAAATLGTSLPPESNKQ